MASGFQAFEKAIHAHAQAWMAASGPVETRDGVFEDPPAYLEPNGAWDPQGTEPYWQVSILFFYRREHGSTLNRKHEAEGILQAEFVVPAGSGFALAVELADRVEQMWKEAALPGFRSYAADGPREGNPPEGWYSRQVDVRFHWHQD